MAKKKKQKFDLYDDCDDRFAYIAGYTAGGFPFGLTWEELGIDPNLPFEQKVKLYEQGEFTRKETEWCPLDPIEIIEDELPFL